MGRPVKRRRTDDPDISFVEADAVMLWSWGIVEWKLIQEGGNS
jgi:hypothetical protein